MKLILAAVLSAVASTGFAAPSLEPAAAAAASASAVNGTRSPLDMSRFSQAMQQSTGGFKCFVYWFDNFIDNPLRKIVPLACQIFPDPLDSTTCPENRDKYIDIYGDSCGRKHYKSTELRGAQQQQQQQQQQPGAAQQGDFQ
ncbi:hypothetical protein XA68_12051 [Ophiocordyceps unilateralis]|uniref:Uncharacterized protein n=1 Tax=Ophiocordyceps unilateralis TaxID=268505 RepID=A0A2A9PFP1_OPHUN|nr:hypothetical protein XA68_12051 [Ophiocordyceps unilateralis]